MRIKIASYFLLLEFIGLISTTSLQANKLIQQICDNLQHDKELQLVEDQQWKIICQELLLSKDDDQHIKTKRDTDEGADTLPNTVLQKARGGGSRGGSIRGGSRIPSGGGSRIRTGTQYRNTRTNTIINRPNGWQWSRTRFIFLPISARYFHRSRSSSNKYTTPASNSLTYYYCTSSTDASLEIQCDSTYNDDQCCEYESTGEVYCCGGDIPDDILEEINRATRTFTRLFSTLAVLALGMHLFMRRFYR